MSKPYQIHDALFYLRCDETIRRLPRGGSFLDVGIGDGFLTQRLAGRFDALTAVEKYPERPIYWKDVVLADAEKLPFEDRSFGGVGAFEMLEHTKNPAIVLSELARVTRGHVYITVPIGRMQMDPGHKHFFAARTLKKMMPGCVVEQLPVGNPRRWFWVNWIP
jgi:ubiquinone/menaquinone biosynthesis C-methylase UbiE